MAQARPSRRRAAARPSGRTAGATADSRICGQRQLRRLGLRALLRRPVVRVHVVGVVHAEGEHQRDVAVGDGAHDVAASSGAAAAGRRLACGRRRPRTGRTAATATAFPATRPLPLSRADDRNRLRQLTIRVCELHRPLRSTSSRRSSGSRTRASAARRWLYRGGAVPSELPARIPGVKPAAWEAVRTAAPLPAWRLARREAAADGTVKYALDLAGATVETVLIPTRGRSTVCVSSQAGLLAGLHLLRDRDPGPACVRWTRARSCCSTRWRPRMRRRGPRCATWCSWGWGSRWTTSTPCSRPSTACSKRPWPGLSAAHVTVSTSGVLPGMKRFLREGRGHLALSLNATTDAQRQRLMPAQPHLAHRRAARRVARGPGRFTPAAAPSSSTCCGTGVNDTDADAARLAALLDGLDAQVNLIPHNAFPASALRPPSDDVVRRFQKGLAVGGVRSIVRWPRGRDIAAACGQLAGRSRRRPRRPDAPCARSSCSSRCPAW